MNTFTILQRTNHWRIVGDTYYRDCVIRDLDGSIWLAGVRDDIAEATA